MHPKELISTAVAGIVVVALLGAVLGFDAAPTIRLFVILVDWFLPGAVVGTIVAGLVAGMTRELPAALLLGGATATALTIALRVIFWAQMHGL